MSVWEAPQRRVELPPMVRLFKADEQDVAMMEKFRDEPQVELYYEPNDETDYAVPLADGSVCRVSETVNINGCQFIIPPGKSTVPRSVYEFLKQCPEQSRRVYAPKPNEFREIGQISSRVGRGPAPESYGNLRAAEESRFALDLPY